MKRNPLILAIILIVIYFFFIHNNLISIQNIVGKVYVPSDEEINYLAALSAYRGEGLYKGFSIVYPPGRFILQAVLFRLLSPSIPTSRLYFIGVPSFFVIFFFLVCYKIFSRLGVKTFIRYTLATIATLAYFSIIYSAQDIHVFIALFFIILLSELRNSRLKNIVLGTVLGVIFLFRIDAGILLTISLIVFKTVNLKEIKNWIFGFALIWIPVLVYIATSGSLQKIFYDVIYLGLLVQPRTMSLPIPPPPTGLLFYSLLTFILSCSVSLSIEAQKIKYHGRSAIQTFALFSLLSFTTALGRSDEGHLWYGSVWGAFYVAYVIYHFLDRKELLKSVRLVMIPLIGAFLAIGFFLIEFKHHLIFMLASIIILWFTSKLKTRDISIILISGLMATLMIFHSLNFLKIRLAKPTFPTKKTFADKLFESEGSEIAGLKFSEENLSVLKKIDAQLDKKNKWLFIYPNNVIYYEYFHLKNPTRYYYHTGETTDKIQNEIISGLDKTHTDNFIIFPDNITNNREVWRWIKKNTYVDARFMMEQVNIELRKRKK